MFASLEDLSKKIDDIGLSCVKDVILKVALPSIYMHRIRVNESLLPVGLSKLGGNPDVPHGFEWPYHGDHPMTFVGQFKLTDVAKVLKQERIANNPHRQRPLWDTNSIPTKSQLWECIAPESSHQLTLWNMDTLSFKPEREWPVNLLPSPPETLPEKGILYFFVDTSWKRIKDDWRIIYIEDETVSLQHKPYPANTGADDKIKPLPMFRLDFYSVYSLPQIVADCTLLEYLLTENQAIKYENMTLNYDEALETYSDGDFSPYHYFYGHARAIQRPVEMDCVLQTTNIEPEEEVPGRNYNTYSKVQLQQIENQMNDWQFLFQFDTDQSMNVSWGDMGNLYICIPKESLKQRRFEDCWAVIQSG